MLDFYEDIPITVIKSKRKTIALYADHQSITVRAPDIASELYITHFLQSRHSWIAKQIHSSRKKQNEKLTLSDNRAFTFLGTAVKLQLKKQAVNPNRSTTKSRYTFERNTNTDLLCLNLIVSEDAGPEKINEVFKRFLQRESLDFFASHCFKVAKQQQLDSLISDVKLRFTKTKWGHCTSKGIIQFNPVLALAPLFVAHYVINHEVCHLKHPNHSRAFWQSLNKMFPQTEEAEQWLKNNGHRLDFNA